MSGASFRIRGARIAVSGADRLSEPVWLGLYSRRRELWELLGGPGLHALVLTGPEEARETVEFWADRGVTSFKAYVNITRAELQAVVAEAHKRGLKVGAPVLGHLRGGSGGWD